MFRRLPALCLAPCLVGASLLSSLFVACGDKDGDSGTVPVAPKSLVTYNAGLAVAFVPAANDRAPDTTAAVAALDADLVCLQEVWLPEHIALMADAAASSFPHQYFPDPSQDASDTPACTSEDLDPLITCANESCEGLCEDELIDCIFGSCPIEFVTLPYDCMGCAMAMVGGEVSDVADTCLSGSVAYAYDGAFGTGILSKWPLKSTELLTLDSTTNRRGVVHAVVEAPDGDMDVYCTHLTAVFSTIPYPRAEGSWGTEQAEQITTMRAWIDSTATTGRIALLGDFNTGPAGDGFSAEVSANYTALSADFTVPYLDGSPTCTFCDANPLVGGEGTGGVVIDHVLLRGLDGSFSGERVLDEAITAMSCDTEIAAAYSDHYGVRVEVAP